MLLLLLTTLSCAPLVDTPERPPDTRIPVVAVTVADPTDAAVREVLDVIKGCFDEMVVLMSTPARYKGPARIILDPTIAEPAISIDGALTGAENTALPAEIPSRSTLFESAKLNVPDAGFIRAQVS